MAKQATKAQQSTKTPSAAVGVGYGARGAQRPDRVPKPTAQEAQVLFPSDSQSFPSLDQASASVPKGSWARGAGAVGRWSNPLDIENTHTPPALMAPQQHKSAARRAEEEKWVTVAPKPKAGGRAEVGASPAQGHAPSAWTGWGGSKPREPESHGPAHAAKAGRGPAPSTGPAMSVPAQSEARKTGRKAPILLSELIPVLRRKDVKMPTPYTAKQQAEADGKHKPHKRTDNFVRNPNAADGQSMVVLRRKEKEGGKKKTKISPLKKLILRDRRDRLDRQATSAAEESQNAANDTASSHPMHQGASEGNDTEAGSAVPAAGMGQLGEEASKLALDWLSQRGMDPANPDHVQQLLNSLNDEDEDDDDGEVEPDAHATAGKRSWSQLPSAVTWAQDVRRRPSQACGQRDESDLCTPLQIEKAYCAVQSSDEYTSQAHAGHLSADMLDGASARAVKARAIPQWAQVSAPEFRPAGATENSHSLDEAGSHSSPASAPAAQRAASANDIGTETSLDVSAGWAAQPLQEDRKSVV